MRDAHSATPFQITDRKQQQAKREIAEIGRTSIYVYDKRKWDIKPDDFCGDTFAVFVGDQARIPAILPDAGPLPGDETILHVPVEYRQEFEQDIVRALREIGGLSTSVCHPFLPNASAVAACFGMHRTVLSRDTTDFSSQDLQVYPTRVRHKEELRFVHVDLALRRDSAGIACGFVSGFLEIHGDQERAGEMMPIIDIDFVLEVKPPPNGEIDLGRIRRLICRYRDVVGANIRWVSFDQYQFADSIQILRQKGFCSGIQSMDRKTVPYEFLKQALYDQRVRIPTHDKLLKELCELEFDAQRGKVDHNPSGSKDLADALAGVVYGLTMQRATWFRWQVPLVEAAPSLVRRIEAANSDSNSF